MVENEKTEIEIGDVESYRSDKFHQFNHQTLVMQMLQKCAENGSHEMRAGWFNEKKDKSGNIVKVYIEDTQEKFSSTVETALGIMSCDFDSEATKNIKALEKELKDTSQNLLKEQTDWWASLYPAQKQRLNDKGMGVVPGKFNFSLVWYKTLVQERVRIYREIFKELNLLTKRIDFYREEDFIA